MGFHLLIKECVISLFSWPFLYLLLSMTYIFIRSLYTFFHENFLLTCFSWNLYVFILSLTFFFLINFSILLIMIFTHFMCLINFSFFFNIVPFLIVGPLRSLTFTHAYLILISLSYICSSLSNTYFYFSFTYFTLLAYCIISNHKVHHHTIVYHYHP